jgi:hypothetical protein
MADPRVAILITAKDLASQAFDKVGKAGSSAGRLIANNWKTIAVGAGAAGAALEVAGRKIRAQNEALNKAAFITGQTSQALRQLAVDTANVTFPIEDAIKLFDLAGKQGLKSAKDLQEYATFWDIVGDASGESAVDLAKAGKALKGMGIEIGKERKALKALGFILTKTTMSQKEFLMFIDKAGPELRELGLDINQTAGILGALENELGLSARTARSEFIAAVSESGGELGEMLDILGITVDQVEEYTAVVEESGDAVQTMADIHAESFTVMQKVQHWISELVTAHGELIQKATDLAPLLIGVATAMTAIGTVAPVVQAGMARVSAGFTAVAGTSKAAAIGIKSIKTALGVLAAFVAGWQIGTMLADRFVVVQKAGIAMAGGLLKVWNWIKGVAEWAADAIKFAWNSAINSIKDALIVLIDSTASAMDKLEAAGLVSSKVAQGLRQLSGEIGKTKVAVGTMAGSWDQMSKKVREQNALIDEAAAQMFVQADLRKKATDIIEDETVSIEDNTQATNENTDAKKKADDQEKKKVAKRKETPPLPPKLEPVGIADKFIFIETAIRKASEANVLFGETMSETMDKTKENMDKAAELIEDRAKRIEEFMMVAARGTFTAFENMWSELFAGQEDWHKAFLAGMRDMLAQLVQMYVMQIVATKIAMIADAIAKGEFTFGASLLYIPAIIAAAAAGVAGLKAIKFAEGGIVTHPTLGLVGEAGPEAIIPLNKFNGMMGMQNNITLVGPFIATPVEAREWARQLIRYIEEEQAR